MASQDYGYLVGAEGVYRRTVTADLTAHAVGNEGVHLLATAWIIAFAENAAHRAVQPLLPPECMCTGIQLDCQHRAPARVGTDTETRALVTAVAGKRLWFTYEVRAAARLLARGTGQWGIVARPRR